eukprot:TRINITY_DN4928_c0_g1_i2.p1 TRINITY_DN4928_c0_g1~~TRINITY_DN4928_c0_g1_i2.p1  ORF type:complete len:157 (-),score=40.06 TRINITY_DN4928_c0_g1_i2:117-587(-)
MMMMMMMIEDYFFLFFFELNSVHEKLHESILTPLLLLQLLRLLRLLRLHMDQLLAGVLKEGLSAAKGALGENKTYHDDSINENVNVNIKKEIHNEDGIKKFGKSLVGGAGEDEERIKVTLKTSKGEFTKKGEKGEQIESIMKDVQKQMYQAHGNPQ